MTYPTRAVSLTCGPTLADPADSFFLRSAFSRLLRTHRLIPDFSVRLRRVDAHRCSVVLFLLSLSVSLFLSVSHSISIRTRAPESKRLEITSELEIGSARPGKVRQTAKEK